MKPQVIKESKIEKAVCDYAKSLGFLHYKFLSTQNGVPDRLFISPNGFIFFIEFKAPGEEPRLLQQVVINKMRRKGAEVYIIDDIDKGKDLINVKTK
jgi:hypothetical protein